MGNPPFEDAFPIKTGGFPACYVSLPKGKCSLLFFFELIIGIQIRKTIEVHPVRNKNLRFTKVSK